MAARMAPAMTTDSDPDEADEEGPLWWWLPPPPRPLPPSNVAPGDDGPADVGAGVSRNGRVIDTSGTDAGVAADGGENGPWEGGPEKKGWARPSAGAKVAMVFLLACIQVYRRKGKKKRRSSALVVWTEAEERMWKGANSSAGAGKLAKYL
jgi:hypothetical protein